MTAFDDRKINTDALIETLYEIQVSLRILIEHLARDRNPDLSDHALLDVAHLHTALQRHYPSLNRH